MDLLDRYLQAVKFWLPKEQKQDIIAELSEDLREQVEDREAKLGRKLNESEVAEILKHRGRPVVVANQFRSQQHLIGPVLFPIYLFVRCGSSQLGRDRGAAAHSRGRKGGSKDNCR